MGGSIFELLPVQAGMIAWIPTATSFWIQDIFPGREYGWSYVGFPYDTQHVISVSLDPSPSVMNGGESIWRLSVCCLLHPQRDI